jgi:hypothetical protein
LRVEVARGFEAVAGRATSNQHGVHGGNVWQSSWTLYHEESESRL